MQQNLTLRLLPSEAADTGKIRSLIAATAGLQESAVTGYQVLKHSIDARGRQVWINLDVKAWIGEPFENRKALPVLFKDVTHASRQVIIVGAGPAGLFAALKLLEAGIRPVILERGFDVRTRRRDLALLNKQGIVNPESNYCFGEGGAGTYSDGKLYTRSKKRGDINRILNILFLFGAEENVLFEAHPHIGTNKLPQIITAIRQQITDAGGIFLFGKKVNRLVTENNQLKGVGTADGDTFFAEDVILATGHSARDIFELLHQHQVHIEAKAFALGVRIEHPQELIDSIQYHCPVRDPLLPPASYGLVEQVDGRGVFSFCMCPGGIIAPAATNPEELVVNGWSPSKRNNPYANSGMVVQVDIPDATSFFGKQGRIVAEQKQELLGLTREQLLASPLLLMYFQEAIERSAFKAGGGKFVAPAQRMADFCSNKISADLPDCSYLPGIASSDLTRVLPPFVHKSLQGGFRAFGKKMRGYYTNDAVVVATESRTSSPVRIPRDPATLEHTSLKGLYPCGEGAGYAGGIVSAAMDGERVADMIIKKER
ncbi:NAD(P)/FAD-dependent oxidoreductase [Sediminibacterium ginsengisoli]|uniref:FAD-binding protein n=1 Tax=Sediminibacterium ginsengisoli TaxID=413434 RepID=A0A1T4Q6H1_9BACT|nr:FAD-dependent oxidoreductase [Sediminibacterium ginsengisoli]SJZ99360.1 hypothetical protein SAMN04488132_107173 [Sediminibacterium ginsengisoli]